MIERLLESTLFASRWLLTPFYFALVLSLLALLGKVGQHVYEIATHFLTLDEEGVILGALALVDLTLTASLIVIVIFSGYANFVSRISGAEHEAWPQWMANIDFSELKLKLMASIAAISAVKLLEAFMQVERESDRDLAWLIGLQMAIIVTGLLMAVAERLGHAPASAPPKP